MHKKLYSCCTPRPVETVPCFVGAGVAGDAVLAAHDAGGTLLLLPMTPGAPLDAGGAVLAAHDSGDVVPAAHDCILVLLAAASALFSPQRQIVNNKSRKSEN